MRKTKIAIKALSVASIAIGVSTLTLTYGIKDGAIVIYEDGSNAQTNVSVCIGDPTDCAPPPEPEPESEPQPNTPGNSPRPLPQTPGSTKRPTNAGSGSNDGGSTPPINESPTGSIEDPVFGSPTVPLNPGSGPGGNTPSSGSPWLVGLLSPISGILTSMISGIKRVPPFIAIFFPYLLFLLLILLMIRFLWQAGREAVAAHRMYQFLQRQQLVAEEKDTFLALSSHYLLTPLTVMKSGIDAMVSLKEASPEQVASINASLDKLRNEIDGVLRSVEANEALQSIPPPNKELSPDNSMRSPYFLLPVLSVGLIALSSNILLGVVAEIDLNTINLLTQTAVFALISVLLYSSIRTRHLRDAEQQRAKQLLEYEATIDSARNAFIVRSTRILNDGLEDVRMLKSTIPQAPSLRFFDDGYSRFAEILRKFKLLSVIQAGIVSEETEIDLRATVEDAIQHYSQQITDKKLTVVNKVGDLQIRQNRALFGFVLVSVIDNAVKFSKEGGEIHITADRNGGHIKIDFSDTGIGMSPEKLPHLFKPFSRIGSAMQFDYEGLGFSLFLDKIIMDYAGGAISADSRLNKGTMINVTI